MGLLQYSDQKKVIEWVKSKYQGCPNCRAQGANIGDILGLPVMERKIPKGIGPGQQMMLVLSINCPSCGHMTLFSAGDLKDLVKLE